MVDYQLDFRPSYIFSPQTGKSGFQSRVEVNQVITLVYILLTVSNWLSRKAEF